MIDSLFKNGPRPYDECEEIARAEARELVKELREISREYFDPNIKIDEGKEKKADKELEDAMTRRFLIMLNRRGMVDLGIDTPQPG